MSNMAFYKDFYLFVFNFLDPPNTVLDFPTTAESLMTSVLWGGNWFIDEKGSILPFWTVPNVDIVYWAAVFVGIDLMIDFRVLFGEVT